MRTLKVQITARRGVAVELDGDFQVRAQDYEDAPAALTRSITRRLNCGAKATIAGWSSSAHHYDVTLFGRAIGGSQPIIGSLLAFVR